MEHELRIGRRLVKILLVNCLACGLVVAFGPVLFPLLVEAAGPSLHALATPVVTPEETNEPAQSAGQAYVVSSGDSMWQLAQKFLGDGDRYVDILTATRARHKKDVSFAGIEDPNVISPGWKLWIPAPSIAIEPTTVSSAETLPDGNAASGHIAISFWNNSSQRCTYEINVLDVAACLTSPEDCQATRRIFVLNNVSEPALSPDGNRIAFRAWGDPPSEESPYLHCATPLSARYLVNTTLDGTYLRKTGGFWEDAHPDWSPDGYWILFDTYRFGDGITRLMLINSHGADEIDLRLNGQQPSWAPDGSHFVFRGCDLTGNRCGLWVSDAFSDPWKAEENLTGPVVEDAQAAHPDWSPISDEIVYQTSAGGSWDLMIVNAEDAMAGGGNEPRRLTSDPDLEGLPVWSPDGRWIAYLSNAGGNWGIWIIHPDGTDRQLVFSYDGGTYTPPVAAEPYGQRDWTDEQISWSN